MLNIPRRRLADFCKMSQFVVENCSSSKTGILGPRLGQLELESSSSAEDGNKDIVVHTTPTYFLHTVAGSVKHITADVLEYIFPSTGDGPRPPVQVSIDSTMVFSDSLAKYGKGIASFIGIPTSPTFLTVHNPLTALRGGYNDKSGIALWSRTGKRSLDIKEFTKILEHYRPTMYQGLSDYDISNQSTLKRTKKSMQRALDYLEGLTSTTTSGDLFFTIEAAWFSINESEANKILAAVLERQDKIKGFVISGLASSPLPPNSKEQEPQPLEQQQQQEGNKKGKKSSGNNVNVIINEIDYITLEKIISKLPQNKPKYIPGPFNPSQVIELICRGVDLFDSSFITQLSDEGRVFLMDMEMQGGLDDERVLDNESLPTKVTDQVNSNTKELDKNHSIISLKDKRYFNDFSPISKVCCCYTCRKHTKAYINHLFATDELLGPVLVTIHNLSNFDKLFREIRKRLGTNSTFTEDSNRIQTLKQILQ